MQSRGFKQAMPPRRDRSDEFASFEVQRPAARMARAGDVAQRISPVDARLPDRKQQSIRDSARGEDCTVRIPGVCTGNPEHTIWSHAPLQAAGKGRSIKSLDLCGSYACTACDAAIDGQAKLPAGYSREQAMLDWMYGHMRSLVRLRIKGLV